jgi:hypothetical protein
MKRWEEHPPSWRAKHAAQGETARKWNAWLKLSPSVQKGTSQADYAAGKSVPVQRRDQLERIAFDNVQRAAQGNSRPNTIRRNVSRMTGDELRWTVNASLKQIRARARDNGRWQRKSAQGIYYNPWWYR